MSQIQSLAALAAKAGEGQGALTRADRAQQLIGNVLRQRQQNQQAQEAQFEKEARLQELNAKKEAQRFSQALASQAEQRKAQADERKAAIDERQSVVADGLRVRQLERLEAELGLRTQGAELAERKFQAQQVQDTSPKAVNKQRTQVLQDLSRVADLLDPSKTDLSDEDRIVVEQQRGQLTQQLVDLEKTTQEAARNAVRTAQVQQTQRAVTQKEAGPKLTAALNAAGQSRVLDIPTDQETGRPAADKLRVGRVYQTSQGPGIFLGPQQGFDVIDELE